MAFRKENKTKTNFSKISIGLASPEEILENSFGEVLKPETINYRTYKPERDGLFCERIFGPVKDYECHCGKYKRIRYKGIVCDRCGVEVTEKKVRRERSGHIQLVVPVAHIWYFRSLPNKIGYLLGLPTKKLDAVIYYERYIVIQPGVLGDQVAQYDMLEENEYLDFLDKLPKDNQFLEDTDPNKFIAKMGAEAIYDLLCRLDLDSLSYELRNRAGNDSSQQRKTEALKRLQVVDAISISMLSLMPSYFSMRANNFTNSFSFFMASNSGTKWNIFCVRAAYKLISLRASSRESSEVPIKPELIKCKRESSSSSELLGLIILHTNFSMYLINQI